MSADAHSATAALEAALEAGRGIEVGVGGLSMGPGFEGVETVLLAPLDPQKAPCLGDVVAWRSANGWVAHRAIWKRRDRWLLKGDGNRHCDGWIPESELQARVTACRGGGGLRRPKRVLPLLRAWRGLLQRLLREKMMG